jgi:hypothetical protein
MLITSVIDAYEGRDIVVVDIPGAFLSADMDEEVIMTLCGRLAEMMVKTAPNMYRKHVTWDSSDRPVVNVLLKKALLLKKIVQDLKIKVSN